jgi:hypothetical protein
MDEHLMSSSQIMNLILGGSKRKHLRRVGE